jgi:hypothetical protein
MYISSLHHFGETLHLKHNARSTPMTTLFTTQPTPSQTPGLRIRNGGTKRAQHLVYDAIRASTRPMQLQAVHHDPEMPLSPFHAASSKGTLSRVPFI